MKLIRIVENEDHVDDLIKHTGRWFTMYLDGVWLYDSSIQDAGNGWDTLEENIHTMETLQGTGLLKFELQRAERIERNTQAQG